MARFGTRRVGGREVEELGDTKGGRYADVEKVRSGRPAFDIGGTRRKGRAVRHVCNRVIFDDMLARLVAPHLTRKALCRRVRGRRVRQVVNIDLLFDDLLRVQRHNRRVGIAMPDRYARPGTVVLWRRRSHPVAPLAA